MIIRIENKSGAIQDLTPQQFSDKIGRNWVEAWHYLNVITQNTDSGTDWRGTRYTIIDEEG